MQRQQRLGAGVEIKPDLKSSWLLPDHWGFCCRLISLKSQTVEFCSGERVPKDRADAERVS